MRFGCWLLIVGFKILNLIFHLNKLDLELLLFLINSSLFFSLFPLFFLYYMLYSFINKVSENYGFFYNIKYISFIFIFLSYNFNLLFSF